MISGGPSEARWIRAGPRRILRASDLARIVGPVFPRHRALRVEPLADGLRNANFKLHFDGAPGMVVLRIYEHDPSLCQKESDLMQLVRGVVPVPEVMHAEARGVEDLPPFSLMSYVEGVSFHELTPQQSQGDRGGGIFGGRNFGRHRPGHLSEVRVAGRRTKCDGAAA